MLRLLSLITLSLLLTACASSGEKPFKIKNLAKTDIDMVADLHLQQWQQLTHELTIKLYKRNPKELKKAPGVTVEQRLQQLFTVSSKPQSSPVNATDLSSIKLVFDENYQGDRVFALMKGITTMLAATYNHQQEFYMLDELDQQKFYNSARNLESINWHLNNRKNSDGKLFLLSNGIAANGDKNYSYERIFSKLISQQDMMALIIADTSSRTINRVVHSAASLTLLPI